MVQCIPRFPGQQVLLGGFSVLFLFWLSGCGSGRAPEAMQAVTVAESISSGFKAGQFHVFWDGLSDNHRADVNQIVHKFAEKMPKSLWERGFQMAGLWGQVLQEKREFALNCPHIEHGHAKLKEHGPALASFLIALSESDGSRLDKLKAADAGELVKQIDPHFLNAVPAMFALMPDDREQQLALESYQTGFDAITTASFTLGEYTDDWALVNSIDTQGAVTKTRFVKEGNRWVPEIPAQNWQEAMTAANQWLDQLNPAEIQGLGYVEVMLGTEEFRLQQMLKAQTQEEFDKLLADQTDPLLPFLFFAADKKLTLPQ